MRRGPLVFGAEACYEITHGRSIQMCRDEMILVVKEAV
jgi:hypothetical protein